MSQPNPVELGVIEKIGSIIASDKFEHCTIDPIFLVEQKKRDYGYDGDFSDNHVWVDDDSSELVEDRISKRLDALRHGGRDIPEKYRACYYKDRWEFVTCCFTKEGAEAFIKRQAHNLKETRIWVDSLFRNSEMIAVREHLKQLGEPK